MSRIAALRAPTFALLLLASCATGPGVAGEMARTTAPITAADVRGRVSRLADDSLYGRSAYQEGSAKAAEYVATELRRLALVAAGDAGTYLHRVPLRRREVDPLSSLQVGGTFLELWSDYTPLLPAAGEPRAFDGAPIILGGTFGDTTSMVSREEANGKFVVLTVPPAMEAGRLLRGTQFSASHRLGRAAAVAIASLDQLPPALRAPLGTVGIVRPESRPAEAPTVSQGPITIFITPKAAATLLRDDPERIERGAIRDTVRGQIRVAEHDVTAYNVLAILPGRDSTLHQEYIAVGAHLDAQGTAARAVGTDSINNGADDNASGSAAVLEIAEALARAKERPRRPVLFAWWGAEEMGLLGSRWYTDNPTIPLQQIVAYLNLDMVGRGLEDDVPGGGPSYLQITGSRRVSSELGDVVDSVNHARAQPFHSGPGSDPGRNSEGISCNSDHASFARHGVPVAAFSTGTHADYHQVTDELERVDPQKIAAVAQFVQDIVETLANRDQRIAAVNTNKACH